MLNAITAPSTIIPSDEPQQVEISIPSHIAQRDRALKKLADAPQVFMYGTRERRGKSAMLVGLENGENIQPLPKQYVSLAGPISA